MAHQSELIATDIESYLKAHENKGLLRFITCGSVDDGKSTLIGRLLYDSKMIFEDQLSSIEKDSKKMGTQNGKIDLALLVDGLQSEREQGITIDVAYRYFSTDKRKFIIADTPGHEQYTRNMATGASTADLAIVLIDAREGVLTQTRRHSYIVSLLGIRHIVVAINKMDLIDFSQERFESIKADYEKLVPTLPNYNNITFDFIPMSALNGDNVVHKSTHTTWFEGMALMELLDTVNIEHSSDSENNSFRFPVQYVNRPHLDFRGFCGTIASGSIKVGDDITVLPSGKTTRIKSIIPPVIEKSSATKELECIDTAYASMAVTLTTEDEIDISRGDMIIKSDSLPDMSNSLKVVIVWMGETPMEPHTQYLIKAATTIVSGKFENINYKININTYEHENCNELELNDIASCKLVLNRSIVADSYQKNRSTGSFIVIDRLTNNTVGAGMIVDSYNNERGAISTSARVYTQEEIELNAYVRKNFPEWGCKEI